MPQLKNLKLITFTVLLSAFSAHSSLLHAQVQANDNSLVLTHAWSRSAIDLSGNWNYSVDPYRDGLAGFHGGPVGFGYRRFDPVDVEEHSRENPSALIEYDMRRSEQAALPSSWIGHSAEMRHYNGLVWYARDFEGIELQDRTAILRIGASNYSTIVYLNGAKIGQHEGGFTPFAFDVSDHLKPGRNTVALGVDSHRAADSVPPPVTDWETYGGITRPVKMLFLPPVFVDEAWVRLSDTETIKATVRLRGQGAAGKPVTVSIPELGVHLEGFTDPAGYWEGMTAAPEALQLWNPDRPKLYSVHVKGAGDEVLEKIGFRTVGTDGHQILLNGEPIFLRGISMHEEELGANPTRHMTEAAIRELLLVIKQDLNGNFVRLSHYPHTEMTLRVADEMGIIVWSEIPVYWRINWDSAETLETALRMQTASIRRDRNRASVLLWGIGNETPIGESRNAFMRALAESVRSLDTTRLVTAALLTDTEINEGIMRKWIGDPISEFLDVLSVNTYEGWYGNWPLQDVSEIAWEDKHGKPLIFSEFGAGALHGFVDADLRRKFSESYQETFYRETLEMASRVDFLAGMSPWILKDFRSPRRQHPVYQQGWNRKGLISETGEKKRAFQVLSDFYRDKAAAD